MVTAVPIAAVMVTGKDIARLPLARAAIPSFMEQTYPAKKLLIINLNRIKFWPQSKQQLRRMQLIRKKLNQKILKLKPRFISAHRNQPPLKPSPKKLLRKLKMFPKDIYLLSLSLKLPKGMLNLLNFIIKSLILRSKNFLRLILQLRRTSFKVSTNSSKKTRSN